MGRLKTSRAVSVTIRLNPIHPEHQKAIEIITHWRKQNYSPAQLIVDRLLRAEGFTPDMFPRESTYEGLLGSMQGMMNEAFAEFAKQIARKASGVARARGVDMDDDDEAEISAYARNLARGLQRRAETARGKRDYDESEDTQ